MREVVLYGLDDGIRAELGSDVGVIADVMEKGEGVDYLIYKWKLDGKTLKTFLKAHKIEERVKARIKDENRYEITAYDW